MIFATFVLILSISPKFSSEESSNEIKTLRSEIRDSFYHVMTNQGKAIGKLNKLLSNGQTLEDQKIKTLAQELQNVKKEMKKWDKRLTDLEASGTARSSGATCVRWGRHDCPTNGTELVYKGISGGTYYSHTGGAVNYVCLPFDPTFDQYEDKFNHDNQNMHGAEYWANSINIPGTPFDKSLRGHNVPCAVCHSTTRNAVLRIPGRNKCYNGWHLEYAGYLMAGKLSNAAASEYACVDRKPITLAGGSASRTGAYFYPVEAHCKYSLQPQCPPYVHGRELTCAICTK